MSMIRPIQLRRRRTAAIRTDSALVFTYEGRDASHEPDHEGGRNDHLTARQYVARVQASSTKRVDLAADQSHQALTLKPARDLAT